MKAWVIKKGEKYNTDRHSLSYSSDISKAYFFYTKAEAEQFQDEYYGETVVPIEIKELRK